MNCKTCKGTGKVKIADGGHNEQFGLAARRPLNDKKPWKGYLKVCVKCRGTGNE